MGSNIFTISADCGGVLRAETRSRPASAMVLADRWANDGCEDVMILDPSGVRRGREAFRQTLLGVRRLVGV